MSAFWTKNYCLCPQAPQSTESWLTDTITDFLLCKASNIGLINSVFHMVSEIHHEEKIKDMEILALHSNN
ncbi:hypothetical protein CapIbe_011007 [Capra ibex]